MEEFLERAKLSPSGKRLNVCAKVQLMRLAKDWECPVKTKKIKACIMDEIQDTSQGRGIIIEEETDDKHDQVLAQVEKLKQELEQIWKEAAGVNGFEVASTIRMVPIFRKEECEEFFRHFERLAIQMKLSEIH